jgi:hypothetical protein
MVTLKIRRDNVKRFSRRIFGVTMSYQSNWLVHFCQSLMLFYCYNYSFIVGIQFYYWKWQFYHWKCSFTTGNAVLFVEMQFHCWKYNFIVGMQFYYSLIAENAILL